MNLLDCAYPTALQLHSALRWAVLGVCIALLISATWRWRRAETFGTADRRAARGVVALVDLQLLLGLLLFGVLSKVPGAAFHDVRAAMADGELRRFLVEHPLGMFCGVLAIHLGVARAKRVTGDARRHRAIAIGIAAGLALFLVSIPWSRPLWRGLP